MGAEMLTKEELAICDHSNRLVKAAEKSECLVGFLTTGIRKGNESHLKRRGQKIRHDLWLLG